MLEEKKKRKRPEKTKGQLANDKKNKKRKQIQKENSSIYCSTFIFTFNDLFLKFVSNTVYFLFVFFSPRVRIFREEDAENYANNGYQLYAINPVVSQIEKLIQ